VLRAFSLDDLEDLYASVGTGARLAPLVARHFVADARDMPEISSAAPLAIEGTEGLVIDYARCCYPLPGDDIRGHISVGRGIVVHRAECRHAKGRPEDWVPLIWAEQYQGDYFAEIRVRVVNRRGLLASITGEIALAEASIEHVKMPDLLKGDPLGLTETRFVLSVRDRAHLARVIRRLRRVDSVVRVMRL
jgi:GTP diphosphokinase / guanosine-3',5'-bis(diphosphate) 3'-diphosphatase